MTVLAHAGHWLVQILYALPVLVLLGFIIAGQIRERRSRRQAAAGEADPSPETRELG